MTLFKLIVSILAMLLTATLIRMDVLPIWNAFIFSVAAFNLLFTVISFLARPKK